MRLGFEAKRAFHNTTGLGNYSRDVLRILRARRPEHAYVAYTPRPDAPRAAAAAGLADLARGPSGPLGRLVPALWRQAGVVQDLRRDRIDLYHGLSNELPTGIERAGIPSVVTIHDLIFERFPSFYPAVDRAIYRLKFRSAARRATLVIAASAETQRDLVERYRIPEERIRVVHQVCHPAFRAPPAPGADEAVRQKHALPAAFVLQVGTVERRKNLGLTVAALAGIPEVPLVVVGRRTAYAAEVDALARARGVEGRIRYLSGLPMADIAALYRLATVAVYPSLVEGFGIPVLEAITAGTPVITSRGGVFPEVGGEAALYVDPSQPEELRAALVRLLGDPEERARRTALGRLQSERFRDEVIADALFRVYEEARSR